MRVWGVDMFEGWGVSRVMVLMRVVVVVGCAGWGVYTWSASHCQLDELCLWGWSKGVKSSILAIIVCKWFDRFGHDADGLVLKLCRIFCYLLHALKL